MNYRMISSIVAAMYEEKNINNDSVRRIIENTSETWQPTRSPEERKENTSQGKIAEEIVYEYIKENYSGRLNCLSYDEIRNDNFVKHAPFDFLVWESGKANIEPIIESIQNDISNTAGKNVNLSDSSRKLCQKSKVKIFEVKSTSISKTHKAACSFNGDYSNDLEVKRLIDEIVNNDDVFCYPHYKRREDSQKYTFNDYCNYVKKREAALSEYDGKELIHKVIDLELNKQCSDVFVRVYIDVQQKVALVIGWLNKERLLDYDVVFKRMKKRYKSEKALYLTKSLLTTYKIDQLEMLFSN